jgi:hypothetical protein
MVPMEKTGNKIKQALFSSSFSSLVITLVNAMGSIIDQKAYRLSYL